MPLLQFDRGRGCQQLCCAAGCASARASDDGTVYARAASVMVPYDFGAERPRRLSPPEREWLSAYLEPAPQ